MSDYRSKRFRPAPYHKEQADGCRGAKEDKRKRADRLWFGSRARLWKRQVSHKREWRGFCRNY
jgi:hypothetical protein